jgi:hypothetical protein
LVAAVAAASPFEAQSIAARRATAPEAAAIERVVMRNCEAAQKHCRWQRARTSTVNARFAVGFAGGDSYDNSAILRRSSKRRQDWKILIVLGGGVRACSEYARRGVPNAVVRDLKIGGTTTEHPNGGTC